MATTIGFNHVATGTADLDRIIRFYSEAFHASVVHEIPLGDDHPRMAIIDIGGGAMINIAEVPAKSIIGDRGFDRSPRRDRPLRPRRRDACDVG